MKKSLSNTSPSSSSQKAFKPSENPSFKEVNKEVDIMSDDKYVRIKLLDNSEGNRAKGFYLLLTNGNTYSDKKDEFVIEKRFIDLLNKHEIKFEELPLYK